jgi:hypothetical protein
VGSIVRIEPDDVIVDIGSSQGAADGDLVGLWRPLTLRHPVTGKTLTDRFLIGELRLVQVRPTLSLAKPEGKLSREPAKGDIVVLARKAAPTPIASASSSASGAPPPPLAPPPSSSAPAEAAADPDAKALNEMMLSLRGTDPQTRITAYEKFVAAHPKSAYARVLWEEAQALRVLLAKSREEEPAVIPPRVMSWNAPSRTITGVPLRLAAELSGPVVGAVLNARRAGEPTFAARALSSAGPGYFAVTLPASIVQAPGIELFIEAVGPTGATTPVLGSAADPSSIAAESIEPLPSPKGTLASTAVWTDYASFNAKKANDYVFQTEGYFGLRFADEGLRAIRSGFGVYRGVGGTLHELDDLGLDGRSVGLTYGYLEAEYAFMPNFSVALRGIIGLREDGLNGGAQGFFRIGNDRETNLLFGGEILGGIGIRGITQLEWNTFKRWPIVLRTEVTNQPAGISVQSANGIGVTPTASVGGGEIGVRAITQVGYRVTRGLVVAGRFSYQGRTINHAGPGAGAAVGYEW